MITLDTQDYHKKSKTSLLEINGSKNGLMPTPCNNENIFEVKKDQ